MARRKATSIIDVTGLSIKDIMDIDIDTFNALGERELRAITSRLVSASNKRIRRLEQKNILSPAIQSLGSKGIFTTKLSPNVSAQQRVNKLRSEFARARNFLGMKTSTIKGFRKYEENVKEEFRKKTGRNLSGADLGRVFSILHRLQQSGIVSGRGTIGSDVAMRLITEILSENPNLNDEEVMHKVTFQYDDYYEDNPESQFESYR